MESNQTVLEARIATDIHSSPVGLVRRGFGWYCHCLRERRRSGERVVQLPRGAESALHVRIFEGSANRSAPSLASSGCSLCQLDIRDPANDGRRCLFQSTGEKNSGEFWLVSCLEVCFWNILSQISCFSMHEFRECLTKK